MTSEATARAVTFGVLGPLEASDEHGPLPLKGPRHRAVLARLLIARGGVVPVGRLVDDLWERPPDGAVGVIQTFVSALRRALEPDRPPRQPARLLVTASPGYALRAERRSVDAWRFEAAAGAAGSLLAAGRAGEALAGLEETLALWRGPAYAEFAEEPWARGEITRLDGLRLLAVERRAEALLELGRAAEAVPDLEAHAAGHSLREDAWRLLALSLYRSGRQGDALAVLRRAREVLVGELGVDPGPGLRGLEADILAQAPHLAAPAKAGGDTGVMLSPREAAVSYPAPADPAGRPFVGRARELDQLEEAAAAAVRQGRPALALVSGDAGAGKTALAEALTGTLTARGWTTAWGRSPEHDGAPGTWPWTQIVENLAAAGAEPAPALVPVPEGTATTPSAARFRMHHAAASYLAAVARRAPVMVVFDDLHRAAAETLDLLATLVTEPAAGPILLVGTYRATEISPALTDALAGFARVEPARVYVGGLSEAATGELVRAVVQRDVDARTAQVIHRRSGGNPFFVRELARLVNTEGPAALDAVPAGVRDVIRHRLEGLPQPARAVLRQAAVIGRDIDVDVLIALAADEDLVVDALESALLAGFLTEREPGRLRFAHALVRDTLYDDISGPRRARWHAAVAETIERLHPDDITSLAHHFGHAESRSTAARAARYARAAALRAERGFAPHEAARLWRQALAAHDRAAEGDVRSRLEAVMGMVRALAVTGSLESARQYRAEAITTAEELGDPQLTAEVISAFDVPAIWTRNDDEDLARQIVHAIERTLTALPESQAAQRSRLLSTLALELRGVPTDRGLRAAREAEAIARRLGDPALLALALNGRFMQAFQQAGMAPRRARIGDELVDLATRHHLVTFEVLGHLILIQAHSALADFVTADAHAAAADRLAEQHDIPLAGVFTQWYAALRLAVTGHLAEAEAAYRTASTALAGSGMPGMEQGILPLALLCLRIQRGERPAADEEADWGPYAPWARPLLLLAAGRRGEAEVAAKALPDSPLDLLYEVRTCLAARTAVGIGDRSAMERAYARLRPASGELAGAGSGLLTLGPVALHLGDLAVALGYRDEAADHYRQALTIADKAASTLWTTAARDALDRLDSGRPDTPLANGRQ
ncbi:BTAD domain-containing putative transcriptional regulator [Streptosporangium amethystogenes]|uniref:BTAD domain-containing putative transcriptional regulator n=1 Tax=Streptosporangium amethystogenes TaxID=2002 RepID=UPI00068E62B6|nr:BTAD domain-containing putative transcriptional regulator [Streptosporangium amethystogenes]